MARKRKRSAGAGWWSETQRMEAVGIFALTGSLVGCSTATGIPIDTIKKWRYSQWFRDALLQVRDQDYLETDAKLSKIVSKSLSLVEDRLENGNFQYDQKTGTTVRIPVNIKDAIKVTADLIDRREKLRSKPEKQEVEKTIDARLAKLADEFTKFAKAKTIEAIPITTTYQDITGELNG